MPYSQLLWPVLQFDIKSHSIINSYKLRNQLTSSMNSYLQTPILPYSLFNTTFFNPYLNYIMFPLTEDKMNSKITIQTQQRNKVSNASFEANQLNYNSKKMKTVVLQKKQNFDVETASKESSTLQLSEKNLKKSPGIQKENRNVASNLLRIFFKNILEVSSYQHLINALLHKMKIERTSEEFYLWLEQFKINFKNYIKPTEIEKILTARDCKEFQRIFRILLRNFMKDMGVSHCLTSKRIDQSCTRRHIEGLRRLLDVGKPQDF